MNNTSKIVLGVLAGAAVGAILGILFAPDKGESTRQKIAESGSGLADSLKSKIDEFLDLFNTSVTNEKVRSNGSKDVASTMQ